MANHGKVNKQQIKGLLFDKDGTLFDFQSSWLRIAQRFFTEITPDAATAQRLAALVGLDMAAGRFIPGSLIVAGSNREVVESIAPHLPEWTAPSLEALLTRHTAEGLGDLICPVDLPAFCAALRDRGFALGIATHDTEEAAHAHIGAVGAGQSFDFVAGYDSGHGLKPGPGMLDAFCRVAGLTRQQVAVIGDSIHDLRLARDNGAAAAIAVLTGPATAAVLGDYADVILPSIAYLPAWLAEAA